jgi:hypothetical protein
LRRGISVDTLEIDVEVLIANCPFASRLLKEQGLSTSERYFAMLLMYTYVCVRGAAPGVEPVLRDDPAISPFDCVRMLEHNSRIELCV